MAEIFEIPTNHDESDYKIRTVLEDIELVLRIRWNGRQQRWIMDILDSAEAVLLLGIVLNTNIEFIRRFQVEGLPPGLLMLFNKSGKFDECTFEGLGDTHALLYETDV